MPYQWNSATFVQNDYGKFQQNAYVPAKPPFIQYAISYIVVYYILHESIKNLQFLITNLCFLSKLFLAWILRRPLQSNKLQL